MQINDFAEVYDVVLCEFLLQDASFLVACEQEFVFLKAIFYAA